MDTITKAGLAAILDSIAAVMEEQKTALIELDGSMGDGDLGLTMCNGFNALKAEVRVLEETRRHKNLEGVIILRTICFITNIQNGKEFQLQFNFLNHYCTNVTIKIKE